MKRDTRSRLVEGLLELAPEESVKTGDTKPIKPEVGYAIGYWAKPELITDEDGTQWWFDPSIHSVPDGD